MGDFACLALASHHTRANHPKVYSPNRRRRYPRADNHLAKWPSSSGRAFSIGRTTPEGLTRIRIDSAKVGESAESSQFDTKTRETMVWRRLFFAEGTLGCEKIGQNSAAWLTQHPRSNQGLMIESSVREYFKHAGDRTAFGIRGSKNHSWYS